MLTITHSLVDGTLIVDADPAAGIDVDVDIDAAYRPTVEPGGIR